MGTLSANTLFHFTRTRETLINILKTSFYPRLSLEENFVFSKKSTEIAYPMVCFCDIPLSQIKNHTDSYGKYAIGLKKEWAITKGISPILYTHKSSFITKNLIDNFKNVTDSIDYLLADSQFSKLWIDLLYTSFFIKPYSGMIEEGAKQKSVTFYNEREWRYILPKDKVFKLLVQEFSEGVNKAFLNRNEYQNRKKVDEINEINESYGIEFEPNDINYIIVKEENEILPLINDLAHIKSRYPDDVVKILTTRIISMERINEDF